jgi:hypothetical protein
MFTDSPPNADLVVGKGFALVHRIGEMGIARRTRRTRGERRTRRGFGGRGIIEMMPVTGAMNLMSVWIPRIGERGLLADIATNCLELSSP